MFLKQRKRKPRRSFVVAVIAIPDGGKSTLIRLLLPLLQQEGLVAVAIAQDDLGDVITEFCKASIGRAAGDALPVVHRDTRSLAYRVIARVAHDRARYAVQDIVLLEHDPNFTWLMERHWTRVSAQLLQPDFEKMHEPDLVLYLPTPPEELNSRRPDKEFDYPRLQRVHRAMLAAASEKHWRQIVASSGRTLSQEEAADVAFRELMASYHYFLDHPQPRKKFWMRGMRKHIAQRIRHIRAMTAD